MSQPTASRLRQLLDLKLEEHGGLDRFVNPLFAEGKGYRLVARAITEQTEVQVSPEILRQWFPATERPAADQAAS